MRVVIDCNVVVSAALGSAVCQAALADCEHHHVILLDAAILAEYRRVADVRRANLIITGNSRDIVETTYGPARVITARAFLEEFG